MINFHPIFPPIHKKSAVMLLKSLHYYIMIIKHFQAHGRKRKKSEKNGQDSQFYACTAAERSEAAMKAGIIAEYNPFHNGHAWQIAELKKRGFEAVVCVCSPGVVRRGTAALFPARVRTRAALAAGADLVLSLPAPYATLSAEGFAAAGVALLSALGCVDALCFGTETRRLEDIAQTAALLESPDFPAALLCWTRACRSPPPARRRRKRRCVQGRRGAARAQ